jgi:hypothetical protein
LRSVSCPARGETEATDSVAAVVAVVTVVSAQPRRPLRPEVRPLVGSSALLSALASRRPFCRLTLRVFDHKNLEKGLIG